MVHTNETCCIKMWKYVSRRLRDTFERSANHFDKRSTTNVVNSPVNDENCKNKQSGPPCRWFMARKCWKQGAGENDTNRNRWNFEHLNRSWIGAITWSSALVLGWYTSQIVHFKLKHHIKDAKKCGSINNIICTLQPYITAVNGRGLNNNERLEKILEQFTPTVHLVSNDQSGVNKASDDSGNATNADSSDDLGQVLNSIENKLGLAAIENGQHQVGINLLRSAANRHHAPALYNLGLCYENGLGVTIDEKMAMEFYRSAASMEHPGALYNLGIYYGQGRGGLQRNIHTATRLLRLAAVQGQQNAIDALKSLNLDVDPPHVEIDPWPQHQYLNDHLVPSHSSLFVENINFLQVAPSEATLY